MVCGVSRPGSFRHAVPIRDGGGSGFGVELWGLGGPRKGWGLLDPQTCGDRCVGHGHNIACEKPR